MFRTKPKVTIGVCVRNSARTIREAIDSIIAQDYPHNFIEVIFVDDGSQDDTLSIIESYVPEMDMKAKIFHHNWRGLGFSRNLVVKNAEGKYIVWVDGDMTLPIDFVRKQVEFMENHPKVGIAKPKHGTSHVKSLVATLENLPYLVLDYEDKGEVRSGLLGTGGAIYRVDAVKQVGGFNESIKGVGEDQDIARRILANGWLFGRSPAIFFEKRRETWNDLWREYFWWGYGMYQTLLINRDLMKLYKMLPIFGFFSGILFAFNAYKLTRRKIAFLLPLQFIFKLSAWWDGYFKGRHNSQTEWNRKDNCKREKLTFSPSIYL